MSMHSTISWTDATWNPVRGCTKVSAGCINCYAETFAERWRGIKGHPFEQGFDLRLVPEKLKEPLRWKSHRRIFVNSMSDLFHKSVPFEFIDRVFAVMATANHHVYQVLTKRPVRMCEYMTGHQSDVGRHVHLGVSVESRANVYRLDVLRTVPAAVRFVSFEPLLEDLGEVDLNGIHWAIVGGESGHGCRPMDLSWARSLRDQCRAAGVPFFFKQIGGARNKGEDLDSIPEDLRIREFPR